MARYSGPESKEAHETVTIQYTPRGVCSRAFTIQVEGGVIQSVQVVGAVTAISRVSPAC